VNQSTIDGVEKFPYRDGAPAAVRHRIDEALRSVDNMIVQAVRELMGNDADVDDVAQDVRLHLAIDALPRFNALYDVKVSTFCSKAIHRFLSTQIPRQRARRRIGTVDTSAPARSPIASDTSLDRRIEGLAGDVQRHPENYLSPTDAKIFLAAVNNPEGKGRKQLARELGFKWQSQLSAALRSIRGQLTAAIEA
jgi:DNA-directed RNA polymerase specialized sigma24 family protein